MSDAIVRVRDLSVQYRTRDGLVHAVDDVSLDLERGKVLALVGESGSGKSTVALSILRLLPQNANISSGEIEFDDIDLLSSSDQVLRAVRGRDIGMIFQDPIAGLNPVISIGDQVGEILRNHLGLSKKDARREAVGILAGVGLADPERISRSYPFQLSGGMCQRVMIGIATALGPKVIIADEPTSSLDVTVQAQILRQLEELCHQQGTAILLITHSFGVVANLADTVAVMYAGRVVEQGTAREIMTQPLHPYSHALLATLPRLDGGGGPLLAIPGNLPDLNEPAEHCPFIPRCQKTTNECRQEPAPALVEVEGGDRRLACYNPIWHPDHSQ